MPRCRGPRACRRHCPPRQEVRVIVLSQSAMQRCAMCNCRTTLPDNGEPWHAHMSLRFAKQLGQMGTIQGFVHLLILSAAVMIGRQEIEDMKAANEQRLAEMTARLEALERKREELAALADNRTQIQALVRFLCLQLVPGANHFSFESCFICKGLRDSAEKPEVLRRSLSM